MSATLHRYGKHDPEHHRGGRYGDLSGQDYWIEVDGVRWEVESKRSPWQPTMWIAWPSPDSGLEYRYLIAWSRQEIIEKLIGFATVADL